MSEVSGIAHVTTGEIANVHEVTVKADDTGELYKYSIPYGMRMAINDGDHVEIGQGLTEGNKAPSDIMRILGLDSVYEYIIKEIQRVYRSQSVNVNDKHIEIIARQMTRKVRVEDAGDSELLLGTVISVQELEDVNNAITARMAAGEENLKLAEAVPVLLGITKASLQTESFLSAASFQETTKVLTEAAIHGKVDHLLGLKENVLIGKLIPAGTGMGCYRDVGVVHNEPETDEAEEAVEQHA
jgi:DNA-directed RNA polymerase subunit beta'